MPEANRSPPPSSRVDDPTQLIGRTVNGKYEVLSILGEGGMGIVYKVRHLLLQNKNAFALKILHPRLCAQKDFQARFLREVEIAMELTHESIVQIRDFGLTEQNLLFYTMDFFPGESLKDVLEREGPLKPERAARITRQILLALAEAHKAGIIHRDLKPENLLIRKIDEGSEDVRILDFGIAKVLGGDQENENEKENLTGGNAIGTPKYMSPEQASCESIDHRSDLYSLGCILYEMLAGQPPFAGKTARTILVAHLTAPPPPFEQIKPGLQVPPRLERLVFQLLEKSRDDRPASAEAVIDILDGRASRRQPAAPPAASRRTSQPWILWTAAATVAACACAGLFLIPARNGGRAEAFTPPAVADPPAVQRLRCNVCGSVYPRGQKVGDMCHGEPLTETE